jgi:hypothetical protein
VVIYDVERCCWAGLWRICGSLIGVKKRLGGILGAKNSVGHQLLEVEGGPFRNGSHATISASSFSPALGKN